jgi:transcriptional regulator with XRE-family HTH domain
MQFSDSTAGQGRGRSRAASKAKAIELGDRIRARRKAMRLSQEQLGERCGLHRTYIGQIERGEVNVSVRNLLAVADGLEVDIAELVQGLRWTS